MDWREWHEAYEDPDSPLSRRLEVVRERIRLALDEAPPGEVRAISVCAGQGRDLLPALAEHPRRGDVWARLVELDRANAQVARESATRDGLTRIEVVEGDASLTDQYRDIAPAHLLMLCGVFGNISNQDIEATVGYAAQLCAPGGVVVWTRHRREPDMFVQACEWFEASGFERVYVRDPAFPQGVGVHRFTGQPVPLAAHERMFTFVGSQALPQDR